MAFRIKKIRFIEQTYHIGSYALPSEHAISVHAKTGRMGAIEWIYSDDPETLKPEDRAFWESEIQPTLQAELKKKLGENRHRARALSVQSKRTLR